ncbi:MAG TPA: response regulator [Roseiflexaceae bacterium]|nr:response regulator [Roseiflexaceae bacterium]
MLILIVDDDAPLCSLLASALGSEGHEVLSANDGDAALEMVVGLSQQLDLIVLDLMMPKMSGFEFRNAEKQNVLRTVSKKYFAAPRLLPDEV